MSALYTYFSSRRPLLAGMVLLLWAVSLAGVLYLKVDEDIGSMIPDEPSRAARHFRLLQQSPLSNKLLVQVSAAEGVSTASLIQAVDRLARAMEPPLFSRVLSGPPMRRGEGLLPFMIDALPCLFTRKDRDRAVEFLEPARVRTRLEGILHDLESPGGWAQRSLFRQDPLEFRILALEKLRRVSPIPQVRIVNGHFLSRDGRHALLIVETPVPMTDAEGAEELIAGFRGLAREALQPGVEAFLYGGHLYTAANAETVRKDLFLVLSVSSAALVLLFLVFVRSWNGLLILLVPASTLMVAAAGTALVYTPVSAVTLGFGAVLLSISIDFGIHVYFALRRSTRERAAAVTGRIAVPILFGGLTTTAAFGVLLFSSVPGQRQLGVFSLFGMAAALVLSLVALPHGVRPSRGTAPVLPSPGTRQRPRWIVWVWIGALCLGGWQTARLEFEADLRELNRAPGHVLEMEEQLSRTWEGLLGRALVVAEAEDLAGAVRTNDRVFRRMEAELSGLQVTSLAPLLPSLQSQEENRRRWRSFWSGARIQTTREVLLEAGRELGFSSTAFEPFFQWLGTEASPVRPEELRRAGLGEILDNFVLRSEEEVQVLSLVPDSPVLTSRLSEVLSDLPGVHVVSPAAFGDMISRALGRDVLVFILGAGTAVLVLLGFLLRRPLSVGLCLVPVVTGLVAGTGGMALLGIPVNAFNTVAAVLILGLGVDYGVFMVMRMMREQDLGTERAVLVSGLTTLAGFGSLALAGHPALHAIGVTVLLGIGAAMPAALLVIPALYRGPKG